MIQNLALASAARLQNVLNGVKVQAAPYLLPPAGTDLPALAVYPGKFIVQQTGREAPATPREENVRQALILQTGKAKSGPYLLDFIALAQSVKAMLTVKDSPPILLKEDQDFTVDYAKSSISFPGTKTKAGQQIVVEYVSIQTVRQRDFQQELFIDAYDANGTEAEKWASLACAIIVATADALLNEVNQSGGAHRQGNFSATHVSKHIQLVEGMPLFSEGAPGYRIQFTVLGELRLMQMFAESPARIEEVVIDQKFG